MKKLLTLIFMLFAPAAFAQGAGQLAPGQVWGNSTASQAPASGSLIGPLLDQGYSCSSSGQIFIRGSSLWSCTTAPTLTGAFTYTGTAAPSSASSQTIVTGTLAAAPTLTNTGQAWFYGMTTNGAVVQGDGSSNDFILFNKGGSTVLNLPTGTTVPQFPGLGSITCASGLALDSSNNIGKVACPGAAASITVGTTTITSGTTNNILYNNAGTLGNETIASILTAGTGISITGTTNATIGLTSARQTLPTISLVTTSAHNGGFSANGSGTYTTPANVLWIEIELVGGGAGGSSNGASGAANASCWNTSGSACTSPVYSAGGGSSTTGGSISGSSTCNVAALAGGNGQGGVSTTTGTSSAGGIGGSTPLGGAGVGVTGSAGLAAKADTGSGGGGGGVTVSNVNTGNGGGAGATCRVIITSPAGSYTYTVGTGSAGNSTGGTLSAGGAGADGRITVIEHYGT